MSTTPDPRQDRPLSDRSQPSDEAGPARSVAVGALDAPAATADRSRRMRLPALALIVAGAALAWLAGGALAGWVRPVALLALAGAGALLATRGWPRRVIGGLIEAAGIVLLLSGGLWPVLGGVAVVAGGTLAIRFGAGWPSMSARYDRSGATPVASAARADEPQSTQQVWDALDRGEDPTDAGRSTSGSTDRR